MSDYLWDKAGEPDPEVAELEALLAPLAYRGRPTLPPPRRRAPRVWMATALMATAALVALLVMKPWRPKVTPGPSWAATVVGSDTTADGKPIAGATRLAVGAWIETGSGHVSLRVADIGSVELGPATRARIVESGAARHRMQLERGTLAATISAPPRHFLVATRHALVSDLGCAFTVAVDEAGQGRVVVSAGEVALADGAREVVVPAGAECAVTTRGPATPYRSDASAAFRAALARYAEDPSTLPALIAESRPQDRSTLRALEASAQPAEQALLRTRLGELDATEKPTTPPPTTPPPLKIKHAPHKQPKAAAHVAPAHPVAPTHTNAPAAKPKPDTKIDHDALKNLKDSIQ